MNKAGTISITPAQVRDRATLINEGYGTNITVFCEGDFNNYAYIDANNELTPIAQGSLSAIYRALSTFDLAFGIASRTSIQKTPITPIPTSQTIQINNFS